MAAIGSGGIGGGSWSTRYSRKPLRRQQFIVRCPWDGGRVILIATGDGLSSSRLLHPGLHRLLCGPLGSPFRAGIPDRDTLVAYSDRRRSRQQTERQLRKDYRTSSYPITPRPFLVTPDGIAPASP